MVGMNIYVQQTGAYPQTELCWGQLEPCVGAAFPTNNVDSPGRYLGTRQSVWACPGYNRVRGQFLSWRSGGNLTVANGAYAYNCWGIGVAAPIRLLDTGPFGHGLGGTTNANYLSPSISVRENEVSKPSDMIAMIDASDLGYGVWPDGSFVLDGETEANPEGGYYYLNSGEPFTLGLQAVQRRHRGRWNVGFCDGHVENLRAKDLWDLSNPGCGATLEQ